MDFIYRPFSLSKPWPRQVALEAVVAARPRQVALEAVGAAVETWIITIG
jgi:hypothetical protein